MTLPKHDSEPNSIHTGSGALNETSIHTGSGALNESSIHTGSGTLDEASAVEQDDATSGQ